jgi:NADH dehydrogenase
MGRFRVPLDVVTGAFSYTGSYIAEELLARGREVRSLSRAAAGPAQPADEQIERRPLQFADREALVQAMAGAETFYNTYWIRFPHAGHSFEQAVENSATLFDAAREAGVRRIVHVSVSNPSADSPYGYFRGKAGVERRLEACGVSSAVVRPTLIFGGRQEILVNNIAWSLRRFPLYPMPHGGRYSVRPVSVQDLARIAADAGADGSASVIDAVADEVLSYRELVTLVRAAVGSRSRLVTLPAAAIIPACTAIGWTRRDRFLTGEELGALCDGLLTTAGPATAQQRFSDWVRGQGDWLGRGYAHELDRNWRS